MPIDIEVTSIPDWMQAIFGVKSDFKKKIEGAIYRECELLMTESKMVTPVQTGALRSSGIVELPVWSNNVVEVTMGYGGPATTYALIVHEDLYASHPIGQAKYLEEPVRASVESGRSAARIMADLNRPGGL